MQQPPIPMARKIRMALIGGGGQAFIGPVHLAAATLDQRVQLVAGALSSDPERGRQAAAAFGIAPQRAYDSYRELIAGESELPAEQRVDFVTIATPNDSHFEIARAAVQAGFHVVCEKPMTTDLGQAEQLAAMVKERGVVFAVAHPYAAYPLVRQIRQMVAGGDVGEVQAVRIHYIQGGLRRVQPEAAQQRAAWKLDPYRMGPSGTVADIGTHAFHLARYAAAFEPVEIACQLATFHPVRPLEDYGHILMRGAQGNLALLTLSQVTHGRLNDLTLEIDGSEASLVWRQEDPNVLTVRRHGQPVQFYECNRRADYLEPQVQAVCRLPGGHPEGFLEAFANLYAAFLNDLGDRLTGHAAASPGTGYPSVIDGLEGVRFVEACISSGRSGGWWTPF